MILEGIFNLYRGRARFGIVILRKSNKSHGILYWIIVIKSEVYNLPFLVFDYWLFHFRGGTECLKDRFNIVTQFMFVPQRAETMPFPRFAEAETNEKIPG